MSAEQPRWRFLTNLGDANPVEYGGRFVFEDETGQYPEEIAVLEVPEEGEPQKWAIYRYPLEPCTYVDEVLSDNKHHKDHPAWFASDLAFIARYSGYREEDLVSMFCSTLAIERAEAYRSVESYHGPANFDSYPLEMTEKEVRQWMQKQGIDY